MYSKGEIDSTHWTLYTVGLRILQLYAPYLPHITEIIYQELYKNYCAIPSIHKTRFEQTQINFSFEYSIAIMNLVIMCITNVRKLKTEHKYSLKTPIDVLELYSSQEHNLTLLKKQEQLIKGITHAAKVTYTIGTLPSASLETHNNIVSIKVVVQH